MSGVEEGIPFEEEIPVTYVIYDKKDGEIIQFVETDLKKFASDPKLENTILEGLLRMKRLEGKEMGMLRILSEDRIQGELYKVDTERNTLVKLIYGTKQKRKMII